RLEEPLQALHRIAGAVLRFCEALFFAHFSLLQFLGAYSVGALGSGVSVAVADFTNSENSSLLHFVEPSSSATYFQLTTSWGPVGFGNESLASPMLVRITEAPASAMIWRTLLRMVSIRFSSARCRFASSRHSENSCSTSSSAVSSTASRRSFASKCLRHASESSTGGGVRVSTLRQKSSAIVTRLRMMPSSRWTV